jgi:hypothetical protein
LMLLFARLPDALVARLIPIEPIPERAAAAE